MGVVSAEARLVRLGQKAMKTHNSRNMLRIATAILAASTALPLMAQNSNSASNAQVQTGTTAGGSYASNSGSNSAYATGQPLDTQSHEGFWGHLNPMARKKWVRRQLNPVKDRLNELDQLTAQNSRQIKDVDARAQAGINKAKNEAMVADQHATTAGNTANQAQQVAEQASTQTAAIGTAVSNLDQYQTVSQVEIRFRTGRAVLKQNSKDALDKLVSQVQGQRGYLIDVQGYSALRGQAGIAASHSVASAVTRYLVEQRQIPLYKIRQIGLGNAPLTSTETSAPRHGSIVEVTLMHNSLSTLSASNLGASTTGATQSGTAQSSSNGTASQPGPTD
jgi:outer membrane protein OmpA-like peptidoglycan-associated protein